MHDLPLIALDLIEIIYFHCLLSSLYPLISCRNPPLNCISHTLQTLSPTISLIHSHLPCKERLAETQGWFPSICTCTQKINGVITAPSFSRECHCSLHQGWQGNPGGSGHKVSTRLQHRVFAENGTCLQL